MNCSIYSLKPAFQRLLRPLARRLARAGVTANQVTLLACALSAGLGILLTLPGLPRRLWLLLPFFLVIRMALNALDGLLAREFGHKSGLGLYLNELGDAVSDVMLYAPFAWLPEFDPRWIAAVVALSVIAEMAGILGATTGRRRYDGPMGKSDRAFVLGVLGLWVGAGGGFVSWAAALIPGLMALLLSLTVINRVRHGLAERGSSPSSVQTERRQHEDSRGALLSSQR